MEAASASCRSLLRARTYPMTSLSHPSIDNTLFCNHPALHFERSFQLLTPYPDLPQVAIRHPRPPSSLATPPHYRNHGRSPRRAHARAQDQPEQPPLALPARADQFWPQVSLSRNDYAISESIALWPPRQLRGEHARCHAALAPRVAPAITVSAGAAGFAE